MQSAERSTCHTAKIVWSAESCGPGSTGRTGLAMASGQHCEAPDSCIPIDANQIASSALAAIAYGVAYTALACEQSSLRGTVLGIAASLAAGAAAVTALLGGVIGVWGNLLLASLSVSALLLSRVILGSGRDLDE